MSSTLPNFGSLRSLNIRRAGLRTRVAEIAQSVDVELQRDLCMLFRRIGVVGLERFAELWSKVDVSMRPALMAFVITGEDPDGGGLRYLDENREFQEAVDLAFAAHVKSLRDLGKSISELGEVTSSASGGEAASALTETVLRRKHGRVKRPHRPRTFSRLVAQSCDMGE
jgi:hypothetical protein